MKKKEDRQGQGQGQSSNSIEWRCSDLTRNCGEETFEPIQLSCQRNICYPDCGIPISRKTQNQAP